MDKSLFSGSIGQVGQYEIGLLGGNVVLSAKISEKVILEYLKAKAPGALLKDLVSVIEGALLPLDQQSEQPSQIQNP